MRRPLKQFVSHQNGFLPFSLEALIGFSSAVATKEQPLGRDIRCCGLEERMIVHRGATSLDSGWFGAEEQKSGSGGRSPCGIGGLEEKEDEQSDTLSGLTVLWLAEMKRRKRRRTRCRNCQQTHLEKGSIFRSSCAVPVK